METKLKGQSEPENEEVIHSLASELSRLKRKTKQSHSPHVLKGKLIQLHLSRTSLWGKRFKITEKEVTEETMNVKTNAPSLGTHLYGLHLSSYAKPNRKYLSEKKLMATTLAFGSNRYYGNTTEKSDRDITGGNSAQKGFSSIIDYCTPEKVKPSGTKSAENPPPLPFATFLNGTRNKEFFGGQMQQDQRKGKVAKVAKFW